MENGWTNEINNSVEKSICYFRGNFQSTSVSVGVITIYYHNTLSLSSLWGGVDVGVASQMVGHAIGMRRRHDVMDNNCNLSDDKDERQKYWSFTERKRAIEGVLLHCITKWKSKISNFLRFNQITLHFASYSTRISHAHGSCRCWLVVPVRYSDHMHIFTIHVVGGWRLWII